MSHYISESLNSIVLRRVDDDNTIFPYLAKAYLSLVSFTLIVAISKMLNMPPFPSKLVEFSNIEDCISTSRLLLLIIKTPASKIE